MRQRRVAGNCERGYHKGVPRNVAEALNASRQFHLMRWKKHRKQLLSMYKVSLFTATSRSIPSTSWPNQFCLLQPLDLAFAVYFSTKLKPSNRGRKGWKSRLWWIASRVGVSSLGPVALSGRHSKPEYQFYQPFLGKRFSLRKIG